MGTQLTPVTFALQQATLYDTLIYNKISGNGDIFIVGHLSKYTIDVRGISGDTFDIVGGLDETNLDILEAVTTNGLMKDTTIGTYVKNLQIKRTAGSNAVTFRLVGKTF